MSKFDILDYNNHTSFHNFKATNAYLPISITDCADVGVILLRFRFLELIPVRPFMLTTTTAATNTTTTTTTIKLPGAYSESPPPLSSDWAANCSQCSVVSAPSSRC